MDVIESDHPFADPVVRQAWSDEIAQRITHLSEGRVEPVPAEDVIREARERIDAIRRAASAARIENLKDEPE